MDTQQEAADESRPKGRLFLISTPLLDQPAEAAWTPAALDKVSSLTHFVVENAKTARAVLKTVRTARPLQELQLAELNEHTKAKELRGLLQPVFEGQDLGLLSETGSPCLADPGASLVAEAHAQGVEIVPLVGPSALQLGMMASGLNGQHFAFIGYLPARSPEREQAIKATEERSMKARQAQYFIETPYRVPQLFASLLRICNPTTLLSVAENLGGPSQRIRMKSVEEWRDAEEELQEALVLFGLEAKRSKPAFTHRPKRFHHRRR